MDGLMDEWLHNIFQTGLDASGAENLSTQIGGGRNGAEEAKILQLQSRGSRGTFLT